MNTHEAHPEIGWELTNVDGVSYLEAKAHPWWRRHRTQTFGWIRWFTYVERCSCGAIRFREHGRWIRRW